MEQIFVSKTRMRCRIRLCLFFFYSLLVDFLPITADEDGPGKPDNCKDGLGAYLSIDGQKIDLNSTLCSVTLKEDFNSQYSASFCIPNIYVEHTMRAYINDEQINSVTISECCYMEIEADNWTNALLVMQYSEDNGCLRSGKLSCNLERHSKLNSGQNLEYNPNQQSELRLDLSLWPPKVDAAHQTSLRYPVSY